MQIPVCYMCKCCNVVSLLFLAYKVPGPGLYSGQGWGCRGGTSMKVIPVMEERQVLHLSCHLRFKSMTGLWQEVISLGDGDSPSTPHDFLGPRFKSHEVWQSLVSLRAPCPYNRAPSCPLVWAGFLPPCNQWYVKKAKMLEDHQHSLAALGKVKVITFHWCWGRLGARNLTLRWALDLTLFGDEASKDWKHGQKDGSWKMQFDTCQTLRSHTSLQESGMCEREWGAPGLER